MKAQRVPRLSLDLLRGFRSAARHLSFTKAAQDLCVTQSAISQEVKALEDQLNMPLFIRVNRTLRLTHAGEQLYRSVNDALDQIDVTVDQLIGTRRALCITATVPFASLWLGPRLARFTRLNPETSLRVISSNDNLDLEREHVDIAIRNTWNDGNRSPQDKICDYEIFPVCSPTLMRGGLAICTPADLASHVLLDFETVRNGRPWYDWQLWLEAMKIRALKPAGSLRFSHYDQVIEAAIAGSGVAIGRWPHLASHLRSGVLVAPLLDAGVAHLGWFELLVSSAGSPEGTEAFITWLRAQAAEDIEMRGKRARVNRQSANKAGKRAAASRN